MDPRQKPGRPWWQGTKTARGAFYLAAGWLVAGGLGLVSALPRRSDLGILSGGTFLLLGVIQLVSGIKLRSLEGRTGR